MKDQAFFLPIKKRPKNSPSVEKIVGNFWHTGIIHNNKVYECFNNGRSSISNYDDQKKKELISSEAVFVDIKADKKKLESELSSGISCSEYVARVTGLSENTNFEKEYWPEEVYNYLIS